MNKTSNRLVELGKNLLIVLLSLSAVTLSLRAFWSGDTSPSTLIRKLLPTTDTAAPQGDIPGEGDIPLPARMAVNGLAGLYGVQYDDKSIEALFARTAPLLGTALETASSPRLSGRGEWEEALSRPAVFFDFPEVLSLPFLSQHLTGGASDTLSGTSRRLLLAQPENDGNAVLYYVDAQTGSYYSCTTALEIGSQLDGYPPNGACFAFCWADDTFAGLHPDTLLLPQSPVLPVYRSEVPLDLSSEAGRDGLLKQLDFTPRDANAIYPAADGWSVRDGSDTLRLTANGTVTYHRGSGSTRYPLSGQDTDRITTQVTELARALTAPFSGAARLCLTASIRDGQTITLTYSYCLSGAQVQLGDEGRCALFTITDGVLTDYTLHLRRYLPTGEETMLLPERQAVAVMEQLTVPEGELIPRYYDSGDGVVRPAWTGR